MEYSAFQWYFLHWFLKGGAKLLVLLFGLKFRSQTHPTSCLSPQSKHQNAHFLYMSGSIKMVLSGPLPSRENATKPKLDVTN